MEKLFKRYAWVVIGVWTVAILLVLVFNIRHIKMDTRELALNQAEAVFNMDQAIRHWATSHGGVYVPTDTAKPNPYLAHLPHRDVTTSAGQKLTLMNPAYILRELNENFKSVYGLAGKITSLNPLRPENGPDPWETKALQQLHKGKELYYEYLHNDNGRATLRYMEPMITREGCLKCHGHQGYKVGDIRGGISVTISMDRFLAHEKAERRNAYATLGLLWALGVIGIYSGYASITRKEKSFRLFEEGVGNIFHRSDDLFVSVGFDGRIRSANPAFLAKLGYLDEGGLKDRFFGELVPDNIRGSVDDKLGTLIQGEPIVHFEIPIRQATGVTVETVWMALPKMEEKVIYAIGEDITESKREHRRTREAHERLLTVLDSLEALVYVADMDTYEVLFVNAYGRKVFGDNAVGNKCWKVFQEDRGGPCDFCSNPYLLDENGNPKPLAYEWEHLNTANNRWYHIRDNAIHWVDGRIVRMEIALDITEKKRAEQEAGQGRKMLNAINSIQSMYIGKASTYEVFNALLDVLLDYTGSEFGFIVEYREDEEKPYMLSLAISDIAWNADIKKFYEDHRYTGVRFDNFDTLFGAVAKEKKPVIANDPATDPRAAGTPEGHPPLKNFLGVPLYQGEEFIGVVGIANRPDGFTADYVTELEPLTNACADIMQDYRYARQKQRDQEALEQAKKEAEEATLLKDKFISLVSHDLRRPLSVVRGYLQLVREDESNPLPHQTLGYLDVASEAAVNMGRMIEDLLSISRLRSGKVKPVSRFLDLHYLAEEYLELYRDLAEKKQVSLVNSVPVGSRIYADQRLLGEVLSNLISNAVKFCNEGDRVRINHHEGGTTDIAIKDTGIGMNRETLDQIFRYESSVSSPGTKGETGSGFGLPLCREIVEAHNGALELQSRKGKGTTATVKLPAVQPKVAVLTADAESKAALDSTLTAIRAEVNYADSWQALKETCTRELYHLIIVDMDEKAFSAAELSTKGKPAEKGTYPLILLLSNPEEAGDPTLTEKKKGVEEVLLKPLAEEYLVKQLRRFIV